MNSRFTPSLRKIRTGAIAAGMAVAISVAVVPPSHAAGLQDQMDGLFGQMTNVTQPGVFESQRRGVLAGGRMTAKSKIMETNLVGFVPPSWKAGCGGVDLFGGSLSFINADQIVQLLRSVAANAKGYAFQLALDTVFPDGAKWIENFQKKVQQLNQYLGNSCQLAQGVVNDVASAFDFQHKSDASLTATVGGLFSDMFGATQQSDGPSAGEKVRNNEPAKYHEKFIGNLVWKQLKQNKVTKWFQYGDNTLLEAIMSLTGTVIVGDLVDDPDNAGEKTNPVYTLPGNQLKLVDFIEGGDHIKVYSCAGDTQECLNAGSAGGGTKYISLKGMQQRILDVLLGKGTSPGVIYKFANNTGMLKPQEQAFLANMPAGGGTIIRNLSVLSPSAARMFARQSSGALALAITYNFADQLIRAARMAMANSQSSYAIKARKVLDAAQDGMNSEYRNLTAQYGNLSEQITHYNALLKNIRKQKYALASLTHTRPVSNR